MPGLKVPHLFLSMLKIRKSQPFLLIRFISAVSPPLDSTLFPLADLLW